MNTASSNNEYGRRSDAGIRYPSIVGMLVELRRDRIVDKAAVRRFMLKRLPWMLAVIAVVIVWGRAALWLPLQKALFSHQQGLVFSYGDFALFFTVNCALLGGFLWVVWRSYRQQCLLLYICNFGEVSEQCAFEGESGYYRFTDQKGQLHRKNYLDDYAAAYPAWRRWVAGKKSHAPLSLAHLRHRLEGAQPEASAVKVYYLPRHPDLCHMVADGEMQEYVWHKR